MSASEKLKALVDDYATDTAITKLVPIVAVLPEIVAVVEAAEELRPLDHDAMCAYFFDPFGTKPCNCSKGRTEAALTALDEKLP